MNLPKTVQRALRQLEQAGHSAYVVGGAVRDYLRGVSPHDFDLCTAALPAQTAAVFSQQRVIKTGMKHGTVMVILDDMPLEITTFRVEGGYSDGRRPDCVQFVSEVQSDLARRDFTINAMAFAPAQGLVDPFGGQEDLKQGLLRAVGAAQDRFREDALRILRGLRMMAEMGLAADTETAAAMRAQAPLLRQVAPERISAELMRLLCGRYAGQVLRAYTAEIGVVLPEILPMVGFQQHSVHHLYDVFEHTVRVLEQIPAEPALRFAALYHDTGKPRCFTRDKQGAGHFYEHPKASAALVDRRCAALRLPSALRDEIVFLVQTHDVPLERTPENIRRRLAQYGQVRLRQLLMMKKADGVGRGTHAEYIERFLALERMLNEAVSQENCISVHSLALDGHALLALGLRGKEIGEMQRKLLEQVLHDPQRNTRSALTALVQQYREEQT